MSRVPVAVHCAQLRPPAQGRDWGRGWGAHGPADTTQAWPGVGIATRPGVGIATRPETAPRLLAGGRLVAEPDRSPALLLRGEHAGLRPGHPGSQRTDLDEGSAPGVQQRPGPAAAARRLCGHGACARRVLSSCHLCVQGPDGPRKPPRLAQGRLDKCLLSQAGARLLLHMCLPCVARNRRLMAGVGCYARSHPQPIKSGERQRPRSRVLSPAALGTPEASVLLWPPGGERAGARQASRTMASQTPHVAQPGRRGSPTSWRFPPRWTLWSPPPTPGASLLWPGHNLSEKEELCQHLSVLSAHPEAAGRPGLGSAGTGGWSQALEDGQ